MSVSPDGWDPATESVRAALFKVVSTADLTDSDQAVEWARATLDNETLLHSLGAGARRAIDTDSLPPRD